MSQFNIKHPDIITKVKEIQNHLEEYKYFYLFGMGLVISTVMTGSCCIYCGNKLYHRRKNNRETRQRQQRARRDINRRETELMILPAPMRTSEPPVLPVRATFNYRLRELEPPWAVMPSRQ
jgi:hypothetical protein